MYTMGFKTIRNNNQRFNDIVPCVCVTDGAELHSHGGLRLCRLSGVQVWTLLRLQLRRCVSVLSNYIRNGHTDMVFVSRSNDSFNLPLGRIKYSAIVVVVVTAQVVG